MYRVTDKKLLLDLLTNIGFDVYSVGGALKITDIT